jgi:hypothetical protein
VTWVKWKLISVYLEIVLILTQDWCTVCAERGISLEIILGARDGTLGVWAKWMLISIHLGTVLISTHDSCMVRIVHAIGLEIIISAPDGTPR